MKKIIKTKQTEKEVRIALEYSKNIISTLREPFLVLNKNLRIVSANRSFYTTFKVAEKKTIGQLFPNLGNRQWDIPKLIRLLKEILPQKKVIKDYEIEHKFKTIGYRSMSLNARQMRIPKRITTLITKKRGEEALILLAIEDVTERKFLRKALGESEERFRRAFETSQNGLLLIDKTEASILNSNKSVQKLLGYSQEEFLKKKLWEIGVAKDDMDFQETISRLEKGGGMAHYKDIPVKTKNGLSVSAEVFLVDRAKVLQCNIRDITKEKEIDKTKNEFVSLASHQLRTPLTSIKWCSEKLLREKTGELTQKQKRHIEEINQGNERMIDLVRNLLNVSRIEMGTLAVNPKLTDIGELLKRVIKEQASFVQEKKHEVIVEIAKGLPKISTDPELVRMVFQNLFGNAVKYTPAGGKITCEMKKKGEEIITTIKDNGVGIPEKQQNQIFQKLFRGDNVVREHSEGTGLELYITKAMVDALGGKIWFESKEGKGTTFWVALHLRGPKVRSGQKIISNPL